MKRPLFVAIAFIAGSAAPAIAGPFGGFTSDGRYVVKGERICTPTATKTAQPTCEKLSASALAKLTLERPKAERGTNARYTAKVFGTKLSITANGESSPSFEWRAPAPARSVAAVFVNKAGTAVVVEYESRFGGRMVTEVVGFQVAKASTTPTVTTPVKAPVVSGPNLSESDQKKYDKLTRSAWKQLKRKKWAKAATAASSALSLWDQSAESLVVLASAKARLKDKDAALSALEQLATSTDPEAPEFRVEARTALAFKEYRADIRFRKAVGIIADPKRPLSAYERLMGYGGKWEQRLISCEQPEVKLRLKRTRKRFTLRIRTKCGGGYDTTSLDGIWSARGTDVLHMTFPNQGADDDGLTCQIERCRDSSGEDCVRCRVDQDLEFLLRVIRR